MFNRSSYKFNNFNTKFTISLHRSLPCIMHNSRNNSNSSSDHVRKLRVIVCDDNNLQHQPTTPDNYTRVQDTTNNSSFRKYGSGKKRRRVSRISRNKKSRIALAATASSTLFTQSDYTTLFTQSDYTFSSSSEPSSPSSQAVAVEKTIGIIQDSESMDPGAATISHGLISVIGRRRSMEDAVTAFPTFVYVGAPDHSHVVDASFDFFAVYDGHGGPAVAQRCRDRMHSLVAEEIGADAERRQTRGEPGLGWEGLMGRSFARMDDEVAEEEENYEEEVERKVGSTALVVVVGKEEVVVANCGDCRAVLGRGGVAYPLSRDHKPDREDEKERVEAAGGNVVNWDCSRVLGVLATSRSIGDRYLKPYIIAVPEVTIHKRNGSDEFLIIASDGLWDVVTNEEAYELVRKCFNGKVSKKMWEELGGNCAAAAATLLAELAIARGSRDNISVIIIELQTSASSSS